MIDRSLTDQPVTSLGLGCWPLGGDQWGHQDDQDSLATIERAYSEGIIHYDTAQVYGKGHGEELLGKALRHVRDKILIASKIPYLPKEKVEVAILASLKRLQCDRIDLVYIHWPKKGGDIARMLSAMERFRERGVVTRLGVSNFSVAQMQEAMKGGRIDVCQLCYNLLWRGEERELMPFCRANGISIVTYSSLAEGILTGKFGREVDFPAGDHRKYSILFGKEVWPDVFAAVEKLKLVAVEAGRPLGHLAIRWLLAKEDVSKVLIGCRTPEQVTDNVKALSGQIEPSLWLRIEDIYKDLSRYIPEAGSIFG